MGPSIGLVFSCLPSVRIAFTLTLTAVDLKSLSVGASTDIGHQTARLVNS